MPPAVIMKERVKQWSHARQRDTDAISMQPLGDCTAAATADPAVSQTANWLTHI